MSSLERQVCLQRPFSISRLYSLSLYIVKDFLNFGSVTVVRYSATVYSLFGPNSILVSSVVIIFLFSHDLVGSNCVAMLWLCGVYLCL